MRLPDLNPIILISFGCLTGAIVAGLFFPNFPAIPEGWSTIFGSTLGVFGAFLVANWTFQRNLDVREQQIRSPIQKRFEYCYDYLQTASDFSEKHSKLQMDIFDDVQKIIGRPDLWEKINGPSLAGYDPPQQIALKIVARCSEYPLNEFQNLILIAKRAKEELVWLRNHKREELSPLEIETIKEIVDDIIKIESCADRINDTWLGTRAIRAEGRKISTLAEIPIATNLTERRLKCFAHSALTKMKTLRDLH
ncbi:hypothetical protein TH9_10700 [Thalassospira xiamenensis]|uniref:hypothetical protein n=1 Tax=Thalassospira xiamenensis TaxID=220697 RepID=UPI000DED493C|nr:hypothetical protein [Thalassospira xiamenensis]RCK33355.1 hypothetical protein TH9_10700 [Thalassospira xiamenensis]